MTPSRTQSRLTVKSPTRRDIPHGDPHAVHAVDPHPPIEALNETRRWAAPVVAERFKPDRG